MTTRGCAYAGAKGVVWGPVKDMVHLSHGPVGCGYYSWSGRRNYYVGTTGVDTFGTMQFTSDFQERDIVFGGDKKLAKLIDELEELFPLSQGTTIESECPVGLIGDDIEAVARKKAKETGKPVVPVRCEGFRGYPNPSVTTSLTTPCGTGYCPRPTSTANCRKALNRPPTTSTSSAITTSAAMPGPAVDC
jgi:nitrogenase molybdenum-iron protein alpha/beta subunit